MHEEKTRITRPVLYSTEVSPPCRNVLLAAAVAGIDVDVQETDLLARDHLKDDFVKMNPQHTIPTLNDNGFILSDSHPIVTYLVDKYAKNDSLYPKDLQKRALVNQFLHFNNAVFFSNLKGICLLPQRPALSGRIIIGSGMKRLNKIDLLIR